MEKFVKIRRIPETDLARITVRPADEQRIHLRQLREFRPPHTLNPFRAAIPDLMNLQYEMLGTARRTSWEQVLAKIEKSKEGSSGISKNIGVARALYDFSVEHALVSYSKPISRWNIGFGHSVSFWNSFYSVWDDDAAFVHFDPRLTHPLTREARRFVFSLMHQRLRVDDPDFSNVELVIVSFDRGEGDKRSLSLHRARGFDLISYDRLNEMIELTYKLWVEELAFRNEAARKAAGGRNPMGF